MVVHGVDLAACVAPEAHLYAVGVFVSLNGARRVVVHAVAQTVVPAPACRGLGDEVVGVKAVDAASAALRRLAACAFVEAASTLHGQHAAQRVGNQPQVGPCGVEVPPPRHPGALNGDLPPQHFDGDVLAGFCVLLVGQAHALADRLRQD